MNPLLPWCLATALLTLTATLPAAEPVWKLSLDDQFEGPALNSKIWNIETGNRRDAMNSPQSVDVKNGTLMITTFTDEKGVTHCGFVTTRSKFLVRQGKAVARCRFSVQPGTQLAFWLQSPTYGKSGDPSRAGEDGVEIDVLETTGMMKGGYQHAIHWGSYKPGTHKTCSRFFPESVGDEWHEYGVEWDDAGYRFTFDGKVVTTDTTTPRTKAPEFLLFSSESTVKSWNGERPKDGYGPKQTSRNTFEIDWVKVWELVPSSR